MVLPAASFRDADRIAGWLRQAPRLQRRAIHQRAARRARARDHMRYGAAVFGGGVGIMLYTSMNVQPGGWFIVPFGAIIVGGTQGLRGALQYFFG